jgi:hypothetical protein
MIGKEGEASKVGAALATALKITGNSLCFCGSGKNWKSCCGANSTHDPVFIESALRAARAYKNSQGVIVGIPVGIWRAFEKASLNRFSCLFPGCREKPVSCHLVPENALRSSYGGHCTEYRMEDGSGLRFVRRGIGDAGCLPVFCSRHDNDLFKPIDPMKLSSPTQEQFFLFALKAVAFSLRKNQYLLSIDSQMEIVRPFLIQEKLNAQHGSRLTIDISHLQDQYIRYNSCFKFYKEAIEAYASEAWDYYSTLHRVISSTRPIFLAGLINPSHDLHLRKVNHTNEPIVISCSVFTAEDRTHILLSCPKGLSQDLYRDFLRQLETADDRTFKTVVNNFLTISAETLLMPEGFEMNDDNYRKVGAAQTHARLALKGHAALDLCDRRAAIDFI